MNPPVIFGVYTAKFPFLETNKDKVRPVIVVSKPHGQHNAIIVVPVSAKLERTDVDVELLDWRNVGLVRPSIGRVHRLSALLQSDLTSQLGKLSAGDQAKLQKGLIKLLNI